MVCVRKSSMRCCPKAWRSVPLCDCARALPAHQDSAVYYGEHVRHKPDRSATEVPENRMRQARHGGRHEVRGLLWQRNAKVDPVTTAAEGWAFLGVVCVSHCQPSGQRRQRQGDRNQRHTLGHSAWRLVPRPRLEKQDVCFGRHVRRLARQLAVQPNLPGSFAVAAVAARTLAAFTFSSRPSRRQVRGSLGFLVLGAPLSNAQQVWGLLPGSQEIVDGCGVHGI